LDDIRTQFGLGIADALDARNAILEGLATDTKHERAFFIVSAPTRAERDAWQAKLSARLILLDTPLGECLARIGGDAKRAEWARKWWAAHSADRMTGKGQGDIVQLSPNGALTGEPTVSGNLSVKPYKVGGMR
jgi:allophanate hydrolase subunit 2